MSNLTDLDTKHHLAPQGGATIPAGELILAKIGIDPDPKMLRALKPSSKRAEYVAVISWLTGYKPAPDASNLARVRGYLDAFRHLCRADAWDKAKRILFTPFNTPTNDDLGTQLGIWGYYQEQAQLYSELYGKLDNQTDAFCLKGLGTANHFRNNIEEAHGYYKASIELFQEHEEYGEVAWLWHSLGLMEADQGEHQNAREYYEKALEQFRILENNIGVASVLQDLARAEADLGNSAEAREHFEESLNIHVHLLGMKDTKGCAWVYHNFGRFLAGQQEYRKARIYTERAFELFREMEFGLGISWSLYYLSILELSLEKHAEARVYINKALELFRKQDNRGGIAWACHILGRIALRNKDYVLVRECYKEKLRIHQEVLRNKTGIAPALEGFAHLAVAQNHLQRGACLFGAAEALRERINFPLLRSDRVPRSDSVDYESSVASIRVQMDEAAFIAAWDSGRVMSMEQAIAEALDESE
jgi:tetratricopeptide (TPR) repeat protein